MLVSLGIGDQIPEMLESSHADLEAGMNLLDFSWNLCADEKSNAWCCSIHHAEQRMTVYEMQTGR